MVKNVCASICMEKNKLVVWKMLCYNVNICTHTSKLVHIHIQNTRVDFCTKTAPLCLYNAVLKASS